MASNRRAGRAAGTTLLPLLVVALLAIPSVSSIAPRHLPPAPSISVVTPASVSPARSTPSPTYLPSERPFQPNMPSQHAPSLGPSAPRRLPFAWRGLATPPGAEALNGLGARSAPHAAAPTPSSWGGSSEWNDLAEYCYGVWPSSGGQAAYLPNCYGHDEPGIAGYSTLPGSGGNATWSVTLPVSAAVGAMQSDLYTAIWFGLPLTDPYAWLDSCFLELQFYPDSSWTSGGVVLNNWIGAAVGWQIEATNGYEDPCYYATLNVNGSAGPYLNMRGGDQIVVRMSGWTGSTVGEQLQVIDRTTGQNAPLTLYNQSVRLPLDPSYGAASLPNGLQWTPGGELPVTFAFETGHTVAPYPNSNSYGGCSAGVPPPTTNDPSVPCPSYDPGSWIADTRSPWEIAPPTFFNATASVTATQVAFTQDLGGIGFIDPISNGACLNRDASEWCSYPWYSYSCSTHAFEFGATDWPTTSSDFGKFGEYQESTLADRAGLSFYPPTNVSVPACGQSSDRVNVGVSSGSPGGATVHFLNTTTSSNLTVDGLLVGEYSVSAVAPPGEYFAGWTVLGNVSVADPKSPWSSLQVAGDGTVRATFATGTGPLTAVRFDASDPNASVQVVAGFQGAGAPPPPPVSSVAAGGTLHLAPGIYSINAMPSPGSEFTNWSVGSGPVDLSAPRMPFTWITVRAGSSSAEVRMTSARTAKDAIVYIYPVGDDTAANGTVSFDGSRYATFTTNSTVGDYVVSVPVGSYTISASATPGTTFVGWSLSGVAASLNASNTTNVDLENGSVYLFGLFSALANVTLAEAGANGTISVGAGAFLANGSVVEFAAPPTRVALAASPPANESFTGWSAVPAGNVSVLRPGAAATTVSVLGSTNLTAHYAAAPALGLSFLLSTAGSGTVQLDGVPEVNGSAAPFLTAGLYVATFVPGPDEFLHGWTGTGGLTLTNATPLGWPLGTELVNLTGANAVLTAHVLRGTPPVTFLLATPPGPTPTFRVNGTSVAHNGTLDVGAGPIPVAIQGSLPAGFVVRAWTAVGGIHLVGANGSQATLFVNGSGTVMPLLAPGFTVSASATPANGSAPAWAPLTVNFSAQGVNGTAPYAYQWSYGDGSTGVGADNIHVFTLPGVYGWRVNVTDHLGNVTIATGSIVVGGAPIRVAVTAAPSEREVPFKVSLSLNTTGPSGAATFNWSVPALGVSGSGPTGQFEILAPGVYTIEAQAYNFQGFLATGSATVTAEPRVFLTASQSATSGTVPLNVTFLAAANNATGATNYSWTFGDGGTGSGPTVHHEYNATGTFDANVTVVDALGGFAEKTLVVHVLPPPPPLVVVPFATPSTMPLGNTSVIATNVTGGVPTYAVSYVARSLPLGCIALPMPPNASFRCTPQAAGNYSIEVNVTDSSGHWVSRSAWLNVTAPHVVKPVAPPASTNSSGWTTEEYFAVIAGVLAVAIIVAVLVMGRGRRPTADAALLAEVDADGDSPPPTEGDPGAPEGSPPADDTEPPP